MPAHPGKKNTSRLRCSSYNFPTKVGHNDIIQQVFEPLNTSEREPHITLAQTMWILNGCIYYSDRGKDRMSVWKTAMIFLAKCKAKPLILSEGTRFFHLSPQLEWRRFCTLGSDFAACVGNSAFWRPQIEWRPNRCRNRYTVPIC